VTSRTQGSLQACSPRIQAVVNGRTATRGAGDTIQIPE
jgi:hypothetical protein